MLMCGYDVCWELLEEGVMFSVLFVCNDDMVLGVVKVLCQVGLCILQDVLLFSFDDVLGVIWFELGFLIVYLFIVDMIVIVIDQVVCLVNSELVVLILFFIGMLILCEFVVVGLFF